MPYYTIKDETICKSFLRVSSLIAFTGVVSFMPTLLERSYGK